MQTAEIIGYTGAFFTAVNFLPQVIKAYKIKNADDISLATLPLIIIGQSVWIAYGVVKSLMPIIVSNCCLLTLAITLLILKLRYHKK